MIEIESINGVPKNIPDTKFGSLFDGSKFFFFESQEEYDNYIQPTDNLILYKQELEMSVQKYLDSIAKSFWYDDINDATKYSNQSIRDDWKQESLKLIEYDTQIWSIVETYFETLTEDNVQDINIFINNLPIFNG